MELTDQEKAKAAQTTRIAREIAARMEGAFLEEIRGRLTPAECGEVLAVASVIFDWIEEHKSEVAPRLVCYALGAAASLYAEAYGAMKDVVARPRASGE